jgi:hypothetical protein
MKSHKDLFSHSKVNSGDTHIKAYRQQGDVISLILFFQNKENTLKIVQ